MIYYEDKKFDSKHEAIFTHCLCKLLNKDRIRMVQQYSVPELRRRIDFVLFYKKLNTQRIYKTERVNSEMLCFEELEQILIEDMNRKDEFDNVFIGNSWEKIIAFEIDGSQHIEKVDIERDIKLLNDTDITDIIRIPAWEALYYPYHACAIIEHAFNYLFTPDLIPNYINVPSALINYDDESNEPYIKYSFIHKAISPYKSDDYYNKLLDLYETEYCEDEVNELFDEMCYSKEMFIKHINNKILTGIESNRLTAEKTEIDHGTTQS